MDINWLMFKLVLWAVAQLLIWGLYWQEQLISRNNSTTRLIRDSSGKVVFTEEISTYRPPEFKRYLVVDLVLLFLAVFIF